jgi:voltage-gated potassium channel
MNNRNDQPVPAAEPGPDAHGKSLRGRVHRLLARPSGRGWRVDTWLHWLILANVATLFLEHVPVLHNTLRGGFTALERVSMLVFCTEYLLRAWLAPEDPRFQGLRHPRLRYLCSPLALIDLLALLPFVLPGILSADLMGLRALRVVSALKWLRVIKPALADFRDANQGRSRRQMVHALVFPSPQGGQLHAIFDNLIVGCVLVSVVCVLLESVHSVQQTWALELHLVDTLTVLVFTLEYGLRLYACVEQPGFAHPVTGRLRHMKTPSALIDLVSILPFLLELLVHHLLDLRFMRVFRLLRLLKLTRYTGATDTLTRVIVRESPLLGAAAFVMLLLVVLMASLGYLFEHEAQPDKFENIPQSIYWAVITLASVGYGDIAPVTPMGRLVTIVLALLGIGIFAIPAALLSSAYTDQLRIEREALKNELYEMLADGIISPDEADTVAREARRLHLSDSDVAALTERARRERQSAEDTSDMPLHRVAAEPRLAVEHYKQLLGHIRQLGCLGDADRFLAAARQGDRLTDHELAVWHHIQQTERGQAAGDGPTAGAPDADPPNTTSRT